MKTTSSIRIHIMKFELRKRLFLILTDRRHHRQTKWLSECQKTIVIRMDPSRTPYIRDLLVKCNTEYCRATIRDNTKTGGKCKSRLNSIKFKVFYNLSDWATKSWSIRIALYGFRNDMGGRLDVDVSLWTWLADWLLLDPNLPLSTKALKRSDSTGPTVVALATSLNHGPRT